MDGPFSLFLAYVKKSICVSSIIVKEVSETAGAISPDGRICPGSSCRQRGHVMRGWPVDIRLLALLRVGWQ